ncbi:MAG TPA: metal-dependent hydrolase [Candidatus Nanoarchaeia archaeon]|nr:metal-dependent hydrolase [Candidatus Nanoarchaeia archaeon]
MLFRTHIALGVLLGIICFFSFDYNVLVFATTVFASLLPDIDSTKSFIGNRFFLRPLQWIIKHRGVFHSLTLCFVLSYFISAVYPFLAFAFFIGYTSHLLLDSITVEGIVPFWPLGYKTEGVITTGSFTEKMTFWGICIFAVIFLFLKLF